MPKNRYCDKLKKIYRVPYNRTIDRNNFSSMETENVDSFTNCIHRDWTVASTVVVFFFFFCILMLKLVRSNEMENSVTITGEKSDEELGKGSIGKLSRMG